MANSIRDAIIWAIQGSLIDLIGKSVPNFKRSTPLWLETIENNRLRLSLVKANHPAFYDDGTLYLESPSLNEATWNNNLTIDDWILGENISIQSDEAEIPTERFYGDRIVFAGSPSQLPSKQTMTRTFNLSPYSNYTLSVMARLAGGLFSPSDQIRITGNGSGQISLAELNDNSGRYQILETTFTTGGNESNAIIAAATLEVSTVLPVVYETQNAFSLILDLVDGDNFALLEDELVFSRILVEDKGYFEVLSSTAKDIISTNLNLIVANPGSGDSPSAADVVSIHDADVLPVNLEFYAESTTLLDVGAFKIEPLPYRTSINFQFGQVKTISGDNLLYKESPIANLNDFGILIEVRGWRGQVFLFYTDELKIWLENDTLWLDVNGTITSHNQVPNSFILFVQAIASRSVFHVYLDKKLILEISTSISGSTTSNLDLSQSLGVLELKRIIVFNRSLEDGGIPLEGLAESEVLELFDDYNLIQASQINRKVHSMPLPEIEIPAATSPDVEVFIQAKNDIAKTIQVEDVYQFEVGDEVSVIRYSKDGTNVIVDTKITNIDEGTKTIRLGRVTDVRREDYLIKGDISSPGAASVRFKFFPIDTQIISNIFPDTNELQLNSATAFSLGRGFVYETNYRDVAEIQITDIDLPNKRVEVSDLKDIKIGNIIAQPEYEILICTANYLVELQQDIPKVKVAGKYTNGVLLENYNDFPVRVAPSIKVNL